MNIDYVIKQMKHDLELIKQGDTKTVSIELMELAIIYYIGLLDDINNKGKFITTIYGEPTSTPKGKKMYKKYLLEINK